MNRTNKKTMGFQAEFIDDDNNLNLKLVLSKFKDFMIESYSEKQDKFLERDGRLLLMAFVKPIINGKGFYFVEAQTSLEKRMDMVITYNKKQFVLEYKLWYGQKYHEKGLKQLVEYLNLKKLDEGYLIVFNFNKQKEFKEEEVIVEGKKIFIVYV
jgi:hypothetical protein